MYPYIQTHDHASYNKQSHVKKLYLHGFAYIIYYRIVFLAQLSSAWHWHRAVVTRGIDGLASLLIALSGPQSTRAWLHSTRKYLRFSFSCKNRYLFSSKTRACSQRNSRVSENRFLQEGLIACKRGLPETRILALTGKARSPSYDQPRARHDCNTVNYTVGIWLMECKPLQNQICHWANYLSTWADSEPFEDQHYITSRCTFRGSREPSNNPLGDSRTIWKLFAFAANTKKSILEEQIVFSPSSSSRYENTRCMLQIAL